MLTDYQLETDRCTLLSRYLRQVYNFYLSVLLHTEEDGYIYLLTRWLLATVYVLDTCRPWPTHPASSPISPGEAKSLYH